jgi:hypothetical protein
MVSAATNSPICCIYVASNGTHYIYYVLPIIIQLLQKYCFAFLPAEQNTCFIVCMCCVLYMVFLMYQSTEQFYNKEISATVLALIYYVEVLLHVRPFRQ